MINIRSITYNVSGTIINETEKDMILYCSKEWDNRYLPHTQRINFPEIYEPYDLDELKKTLRICDYSSVRWINIPINPMDFKSSELVKFAQDVIYLSGRTFVNYIGVENGVINKKALKDYAMLCKNISYFTASGIDNFRLGLSNNIGYDCPFFPFTRSNGKNLSFTIALELVQDINRYVKQTKNRDLETIRNDIIEIISKQVSEIYDVAIFIQNKTGISFGGFDFSLAPVIGDYGSVITLLNSLGVSNFGYTGTMFATSYITDILKEISSRFPSVGFSGVMYSLLEDLELCRINNERGVSVEQLTMLSTMCGCGLDMVPICEDVTSEEICSCCLDIAAISCKYDKPLGVRLLPIPGAKRFHESRTSISDDADFISNTRVVQLDANIFPNSGDVFKYLKYGRQRNEF